MCLLPGLKCLPLVFVAGDEDIYMPDADRHGVIPECVMQGSTSRPANPESDEASPSNGLLLQPANINGESDDQRSRKQGLLV